MRIDANSAFISVLWLIVLRNRKCTLSVGFTNGLALPGYTVILRRPRITQITTYENNEDSRIRRTCHEDLRLSSVCLKTHANGEEDRIARYRSRAIDSTPG